MPLRNPRAFLDISVGGRAVGRLKFELFRDVLPISAENFRALCTGETGLGYYMQPRYYKHSMLHRNIPGVRIDGESWQRGLLHVGC
mmetsp:Transcript_123391/g.282845  ORF Transcript_123391/g.282845 Transcript_123391/m.282845 type:complete len:86 (-) Transcript_123391:542-799(-)